MLCCCQYVHTSIHNTIFECPPPPSLSRSLSSPLAKSHSNRVVAFLLQKLEVSQEKVRLATLNVIKHLINSCDAELEDKKPLLISGLTIILQEQSLKVGLPAKMLTQHLLLWMHLLIVRCHAHTCSSIGIILLHCTMYSYCHF